ncbi:hypothetical protein ACVNIS_10345 [Sphaerotilaceae bacterium SBD11-9]
MMIDPKLVFSVLGPLFLLLAAWRVLGAGRFVPQATAWLSIGAIFSGVAIWLWWQAPA